MLSYLVFIHFDVINLLYVNGIEYRSWTNTYYI